jgi:hypothetical protein
MIYICMCIYFFIRDDVKYIISSLTREGSRTSFRVKFGKERQTAYKEKNGIKKNSSKYDDGK